MPRPSRFSEAQILEATATIVAAGGPQLTTFAMIDVPLAAVRRHVASNEMPPRSVEDLIARTYAALIAPARRCGRRTKAARP
jgi:hypothetical protein